MLFIFGESGDRKLQKNQNLPLIIFECNHKIVMQTQEKKFRRETIMAKTVVPEAKDALNRFKMEAANEVDVPDTY